MLKNTVATVALMSALLLNKQEATAQQTAPQKEKPIIAGMSARQIVNVALGAHIRADNQPSKVSPEVAKNIHDLQQVISFVGLSIGGYPSERRQGEAMGIGGVMKLYGDNHKTVTPAVTPVAGQLSKMPDLMTPKSTSIVSPFIR